MIHQELLERGLNGLFWQERAWRKSPGSSSSSSSSGGGGGGQQQQQRYYFSSHLGELRLDAPPLVRGGLLCEESEF